MIKPNVKENVIIQSGDLTNIIIKPDGNRNVIENVIIQLYDTINFIIWLDDNVALVSLKFTAG
jgi:hypothetical protein